MYLMATSRLKELYRLGGAREVLRGIRDWMVYWGRAAIESRLYSTRVLTVDGASVRFTVADAESIRRTEGHGETEIISHFLSRISEDDIVWDVGANQGTYALFAAQAGAEVHAFEPNSRLCDILQRNSTLNGVDVTVHNVALSSKEGIMVLRQAGHAGGRWIDENGPGDKVRVRRGDVIDVASPTVMKVDVEGHEIEVLAGMPSRLKNLHTCYVECHDEHESMVTDRLREAGFETEEKGSKFVLAEKGRQ